MSGARSGRPHRQPLLGQDALERALRYALGAAEDVTPEIMHRPTPCRGWNLRMLLLHACESLSALAEGFDCGRIAPSGHSRASGLAAEPTGEFRERASRLLGSFARAELANGIVTIGGCPMETSLLATAGALEVAVHGWDIAQTCRRHPPIPAPLAIELLRAAPLLISLADRDELFAAPVPVAAGANPSDRLAAYLGRSVA
jgi:uncharacterized protein (TIGR03086 family)